MDQNFQTSFIPKKPVVKERVESSRPVGILLVASIIVLITVLLATGGIYFAKESLVKAIKSKQETLDKARNRFEYSKIAELQLLDKRLRASTDILNKHISVVPIFSALEKVTMKTVRYTKFSYALSADKSNKIDVKMSGIAIGYKEIALQSDLFTTNDIVNKNFIDPVFSNLTLDVSGNVLFDLAFSVDPSFLNYKQTLLIES